MVRDEVFPHFRTLGGSDIDLRRVHERRPAHDSEAEPAGVGGEHDRRPAARPRATPRATLRVPAQQADHGRHQRPVPHAPAHHPLHGRSARAEADRSRRRPGLRHGGLPGRRHAAPAGEVHLAQGRLSRTTTARRSTPATCWSRTASTSRTRCSTASTSTATMLRIAAMNLMLHGVDHPDIHYQDTPQQLVPGEVPASRRPTAST